MCSKGEGSSASQIGRSDELFPSLHLMVLERARFMRGQKVIERVCMPRCGVLELYFCMV